MVPENNQNRRHKQIKFIGLKNNRHVYIILYYIILLAGCIIPSLQGQYSALAAEHFGFSENRTKAV
jgi:hypothetical protein